MCKPLQNPTSTPTMLHLKMQLYYHYSNVCPTNSDINPTKQARTNTKQQAARQRRYGPMVVESSAL